MRLITIKRIVDFANRHSETRQPLMSFARIVQAAQWRTFQEVRKTYPHADAVKVKSGRTVTVFNVMGNNIRVVTAIHYNSKIIYILFVLTHQEYDRGKWKEVL